MPSLGEWLLPSWLTQGLAHAFLAQARNGFCLVPINRSFYSAEPRIEPPACAGSNGYSSTALWPTRSLELARERQIDRSVFLPLSRWTVLSESAVKFRSCSLLLSRAFRKRLPQTRTQQS